MAVTDSLLNKLTNQLILNNKEEKEDRGSQVKELKTLNKTVMDLLKFNKNTEKARQAAFREASREASTGANVKTTGGDSTPGGGFGFGKIITGVGAALARIVLKFTGFGKIITGVSAWASRFFLKFKKYFSMLKRILRIGARATGIGGLIFLIYQTFKDIGDNPMFKETMEKLTKLWNEDIGPRLTVFKDLVQDFFLNGLNVVVDSAESIFCGLDALMDGEWKLGMKNLLRGTLGYDWDTGKFVNEGIWGVIASSITGILGIFGIETTPAELTKELNESITKTISSVTGWITGTVDGITTWVDESSQMLGDAWETTKTSFKEKWEAFSGFFTIDIPLWFSSRKLDFDLWLGDLKIDFTEKWEALSGFFTETIPSWFETTKKKFVTAWDASKDLLKNEWNNIVKFFTELVPAYFTNWYNTIGDGDLVKWIKAQWEKITGWFSDVSMTMKITADKITATGAGLLDIISGKWDSLVEWITVDVPSKMLETWNTIKAGGTGLLDKISGKWESVKSFFTEVIPGIISEFDISEFDLMKTITSKVSALVDMISDLIPNISDIKNNVISKISGMSGGDELLNFMGIEPQPAAFPNDPREDLLKRVIDQRVDPYRVNNLLKTTKDRIAQKAADTAEELKIFRIALDETVAASRVGFDTVSQVPSVINNSTASQFTSYNSTITKATDGTIGSWGPWK